MARESLAHVARRRLLGVLYLVVLVSLIALSIMAYNKDFTKVVLVTLHTDRTGNQLMPQSDVKERGIIVGEVRKITSDGQHGAIITLALNPGRAKSIKNYYTAQLLPKTLFGERYVALQPDSPAVAAYCVQNQPPGPLRGGEVLCQDQSKQYQELSALFEDITPLLDVLKPAELNATLNALATALQGRGDQLGRNLTQANDYLKQLNPHVPQLVDDLTKLGKVADEYTGASPDLFQTLQNLQTTSRTLVEKRAALDSLLGVGASTATVLKDFLATNAQRLIEVTGTSKQILGLLAEYSPEYDCLLASLAKAEPRLEQAFSGGMLHITLETIKQRGKYVPGNEPIPVTGRGPNCLGLPNAPVPFQPPKDLDDGAPSVGGAGTGAQATANRGAYGAGSDAESKLVNTLISAQYGTTPDQVPAIATVLAAPLLRGAEVRAQ